MDDFLQKLKKVVRTVLYGPAVSQSYCRKPGPYQLPYNKIDNIGNNTKDPLYILHDKS